MAQKSDAKQLDNLDILKEAVRNRSVELHYHNLAGEFFSARTRFLGMNDTVIYLDTPQSIGKAIHFSQDQMVEVFIMAGDQIQMFRTKILKTNCNFKLNRKVISGGLQISKPALVKDGQRRHAVRVSVASLEDIRVVMHEAQAENPNTTLLDSEIFEGRIVNVSTGGCGVQLNTTLVSKFNSIKEMFLRFTLPDQEEELIFQVEVRSVALVGTNRKSTRLGLQFLNWPNQAHLRRTVRPLERFIVEMQRAAKRNQPSNR